MFAGMTLLLAVTAEAAEKAAQSGGLPQLNPEYFTPQLFWLTLTFIALLFIMQKIALPRVGEVIEEVGKVLSTPKWSSLTLVSLPVPPPTTAQE